MKRLPTCETWRPNFLLGVLGVGLALTLSSSASAAPITNSIYDADIFDIADGSVGSWTASTGAAHPTGAGNELLFPSPSTSFSTLRVYSGGGPIDYTFGGSGGGISLDPFVTGEGASPLAGPGEGWRTVWTVTPELIGITQDVLIVPPAVGASVANSAIYHTVLLSNLGSTTASVGWRNLYDWGQTPMGGGFDDGPANQIELSDSTVLVPSTTTEFSYTPAGSDLARVTVDPGTPIYETLLGLGFDPGFRMDLPVTTPDEYAYVSWPGSVGTAFDYVPGGAGVTGDSAGLSWFGRDAARAIDIAPGGSVRLTQVLFGVLPDAPPPGNPVPEPTSMALFGLTALGFGVGFRRRRGGEAVEEIA